MEERHERPDGPNPPEIDVATCIDGLRSAGTLACATRSPDGAPRVRFLSGLHLEQDAVYILASNGMPFARQLLADKRIQLLGEIRRGVSVRLTGEADLLPEEDRMRWRLVIFRERPDYRELYPPLKYDDSLVFALRTGYFEYLDLVSSPIRRVYVPFGGGQVRPSGFEITSACARCGSCQVACPQGCIRTGEPFRIVQENCLQCGACVQACPRGAIRPVV